MLHFLAVAKTAGIDLTLDDFQRISDSTPYIADLRPRYVIHLEQLNSLVASI